MKLNFTKMHGCGNDYIYINCFNQEIKNPQKLSIKLSDRHYGIGGDGIILICPSDVADAKMRMFNLDGSEGKMCGNGIRCVGKYLYDNSIVKKDEFKIETLAGVKFLKIIEKDKGLVKSVCVDMGKAEFSPPLIPVKIKGEEKIINMPVEIGESEYNITCVSMGNPHCVVFCENLDSLEIERIGPMFENNSLFPVGINTEFIRILDANTIEMRVWERGSGETWACGTGACAVAVAAVENGFCKKNEDIMVRLKGGDLVIKYTDDKVYMTGNAIKVFEGEIEI